MNGKDLEGNIHGEFRSTVDAFAWRNWGGPRRTCGLHEVRYSHLAVPVASIIAWISLLDLGFSYRVLALSDWVQALSDWVQALSDWVQALSDWVQTLSKYRHSQTEYKYSQTEYRNTQTEYRESQTEYRHSQTEYRHFQTSRSFKLRSFRIRQLKKSKKAEIVQFLSVILNGRS